MYSRAHWMWKKSSSIGRGRFCLGPSNQRTFWSGALTLVNYYEARRLFSNRFQSWILPNFFISKPTQEWKQCLCSLVLWQYRRGKYWDEIKPNILQEKRLLKMKMWHSITHLRYFLNITQTANIFLKNIECKCIICYKQFSNAKIEQSK